MKLLVMRFVGYTLVIFIFAASLPIIVQHGGANLFRENGPIEWLQFLCLSAASSIFIAGFRSIPIFRETLLILASVSALAAVREMDGLLDGMWVGWKAGYVLLLPAVGLAYANRSRLGWQMAQFFSSPAFVVLWAGFIVAVPIAQLFGHGAFLESLMGDNYIRTYKRVLEECGELVGYLLLVAGSIESALHMKAAQLRKPAQVEVRNGGGPPDAKSLLPASS